MKTTAVIALLLVTLPTWVGTFLDDFGDGDLEGWEISLMEGRCKIYAEY